MVAAAEAQNMEGNERLFKEYEDKKDMLYHVSNP